MRAGREPLNPLTTPQPPDGGSAAGSEVLIEETFTSPRGRLRRRFVAVDVDAVRAGLLEASDGDRRDWERFREAVRAAVGEDRFAVWFSELGLAGVDHDHRLVAVVPFALRAWLVDCYARVIADAGERAGRVVVIADEALTQALLAGAPSADARSAVVTPAPGGPREVPEASQAAGGRPRSVVSKARSPSAASASARVSVSSGSESSSCVPAKEVC